MTRFITSSCADPTHHSVMLSFALRTHISLIVVRESQESVDMKRSSICHISHF